jgi:site-specific DNA-methyltransferase (adenine-specific)
MENKQMELNKIYNENCLEFMKTLPANSVDSIVTDPPYHLVSIVKRFGGENARNTPAMNTKEGGVFARKAKGFMGKEWDGLGEDGIGIANNPLMWAECLRVLKPGGYLLSFGGTRTYHRMASAIEDAGFEVRDMIEWVYGSGFPKSLNIGKAVDKLQGNKREVVGTQMLGGNAAQSTKEKGGTYASNTNAVGVKPIEINLTKGTSEWEGWGTALKPSHEPICLARKPIECKTVAENVLKYGTGGINIDVSRVGTEEITIHGYKGDSYSQSYKENGTKPELNEYKQVTGRFPANLITDGSEEVRECFPETNASKSANRGLQHSGRHGGLADIGGNIKDGTDTVRGHDDNGGNASRFFKSIIYQAKASKSERNKGCEEMEDKERIDYGGFHSEKGLIENNRNPENRLPSKNNHPTVKPIALMEYLIKMVTPKGGVVLDPFAGSGSTLVAAKQNGYQYIGIEMTAEYISIIEARLESIKRESTLF